jgi:hypothetical protein
MKPRQRLCQPIRGIKAMLAKRGRPHPSPRSQPKDEVSLNSVSHITR